MLSVFPDTLYLGLAYAPFILRITLAVAIASFAFYHLKHSHVSIAQSVAPWLHSYARPLMKFSALVSLGIATLLVVGLFTQVAALLSIVLCIKVIVLKKRHPVIAPESKNYYILLLIIAIVVFLAGAGPFAFDLPI